MSTTELVEQIRTLPREEKWKILRFLNEDLETPAHERLFEDFSLIGAEAEVSDVTFAEAAQAEVLRHG